MNFDDIKIVSIDDNETNLYLIEMICSDLNLNVKSFSDPVEGLVYVLQNKVDMILIDYMMPELNGIEFIQEYRQTNQIVPIIMITALGEDEEIHKKAYDVGASDFMVKPVNTTLFETRVFSHLTIYKNRILLEDKAKLLEEEVLKATQKLRESQHETLDILAKTAEYKDPETASHVLRVSYYSKLLAKVYGLSDKEIDLIFHASPFHDLGKVGIEDKILLKPGKLTPEEYEKMKTHSVIGYKILKDAKSEYLQAGAIISLSHHEKYDGTGYPKGLSGEDIHIFGRIVSLVDVFDAITSNRPYKKAWSIDTAIDLLKKESGKHFDPKLVELFIENIEEVKKIHNKFQEN